MTTCALFRRIRGSTIAEPLSAEAVALIVKRRAQLAGLQEDFAAHSLRSDFVTEAGRQNVPLGDTMAMTAGERGHGTHDGSGECSSYVTAAPPPVPAN